MSRPFRSQNRNNRNGHHGQNGGNNNVNNHHRPHPNQGQSQNQNQNQNSNGRNFNRTNQHGRGGNGSDRTCHNCGQNGHIAANCQNTNRNNNRRNSKVNKPQFNNRNNAQHGRNPQSSWCSWCKKDNHSTEDCRYPPTICLNCLKKGHSTDACRDHNPYLPIERDPNGNCHWCHAPWHAGKECLDKQIEEYQAHGVPEDHSVRSVSSRSVSNRSLPSRQSPEVILSVSAPSAPSVSEGSSNPLATMTNQAWGPRVHAANPSQHTHHRLTCETCHSPHHRTTECLAIHPCTACASPFHTRAACADIAAAQPFLKPAVTLWQKRPEHEHTHGPPRYCVYCNSTAHASEACVDEAAQAAHLLSPLRCGQCGKRGHTEASCLNPVAQWGGPPTLQNLREQDWSAAWLAGWRPACSRCEFAMDVLDVWNGEVDAAMGGAVSGRLFIPADGCSESVVWWVKMDC